MDIDGDISRRDFAKIAGLSGIAAAGGVTATSVSIADLLSGDSSNTSSGGPAEDQYDIVNETISREAYQEIYSSILEEDRRTAQQIMSPRGLDVYFNDEGTEFAEMEVNYHPDPDIPDNSKVQIGLVDTEDVEDLSDIPEGEISYSGWKEVSDKAAETLLQEFEEYQEGRDGYGN